MLNFTEQSHAAHACEQETVQVEQFGVYRAAFLPLAQSDLVQ